MTDATRLKASEIEYFLETGKGLDNLITIFERVLTIFKEEGNSNFILGKVIIENDISEEEDE